ncbi:MAG TPA: hypothetical protein VF733_00695 [Candidatus Saccharimonadales bacterium]
MTRYLSAALGAAQPFFGQSIMELERASGRPGADIRLTSEVTQQLHVIMKQLGLDPSDTTGPELYSALLQRLQQDESRVRTVLTIDQAADPNDVLAGVQAFLNTHRTTGNCFALKATTTRRLFKKKAPKATMKLLGYRSLDSMLKHEVPAAVYAAALIAESASWHRNFQAQYDGLQTSDFEQRKMQVLYPSSTRWTSAASEFVSRSRNNILSFKELGAVVILPLSGRVEGLALTTILLVLHYLNDIRTFSSYAKLQQVKLTFGQIIHQASEAEPMTSASLAGQPVPWKVIQRYYGKMQNGYHPEVFEPHVQPDDLQWHDGEKIVAELQPALHFWESTQHVSMLYDGQPVSCNILDVALSYCNTLPFADRIVHFVREHLWHELMSRYLHQENLEAAVHQQLSRELVDATALAEL